MRGDPHELVTVDGNEAVARIAHLLSEVIAIYPITPASPMGEHADAWSQQRRENLWGSVPTVIEMQSEGGAAGTVHGSLQAGALTTTFTASQGLLLMIPNLYKIAGELLPCVIHVAARTIATHALSIFGDHSDVMAARATGMAMIASGSVQEAQDLALISHATTIQSRVPIIHFFDGFRTSHEVATIEQVSTSTVRGLIDDDLVVQHRLRGLDPDHPVVRGTAQNPDVFFQAAEAANVYHRSFPTIVQQTMDRFAVETGRSYQLFDYHGHPEAETVLVAMGSGAGTVCEAIDHLVERGERVGAVTVRLYRPFDSRAFMNALPRTTQHVTVLDRTKEHGATGEPLYLDVVAALSQCWPNSGLPLVARARYGLSSKEFTPAMVLALVRQAALAQPDREMTVGIIDDITNLSIDYDPDEWTEPAATRRAVFYGLGSDGTVSANKNSVKIIGEQTDQFAQGYFVYDSKKSGSETVSHLRFGPEPIRSAYLIRDADFVAVHDFGAFSRHHVLSVAGNGATVLINTPFGPEGTWSRLPAEEQEAIQQKNLRVWIVDAGRVARDHGLGNRVNTVLQTCFFSLSDVMNFGEAVQAIKTAVAKSYGRRGDHVVDQNNAAIDAAVPAMERIQIPAPAAGLPRQSSVPEIAPEFVQRVTAKIMAGEGDLLPVSAFPADGTFPSGTSQWEKRSLATEIPIWDPELCIDCGRCALVCPHAAIRIKSVPAATLEGAPGSFLHKAWKDKRDPTRRGIVQVAPDDCTGCAVCVSICPAHSKEDPAYRSINMEPVRDHLATERTNWNYFESLPEHDRSTLRIASVKGSQLAQPLFEFSGACAGCGETPYLKLLTQLMGDRMVVANATGCSSIYGGNLPTTPWAVNHEGRGPAWANSLFEDNAEFGLGMRVALDHHADATRAIVTQMARKLGPLANELLEADQTDETGIELQRERVAQLLLMLDDIPGPEAERLKTLAGNLVKRSVWIVGGDGWAYDIGYGGVDHVLASGQDVNILVLDTEVYSNTGGQTSKSTPRGAIAKFSSGGKTTAKKDLGMIAMSYDNVYVAHIAMGANMTQTVKALSEAAAHRGPSLVIAYSPCIAHGIDLTDSMERQRLAAASGYWPLYRYDPGREADGDHALHLDSRKPTVTFADFAAGEARFAGLGRMNPAEAQHLLDAAQRDIDDRWHLYEQMVDVERSARFGEIDDEAVEDWGDS